MQNKIIELTDREHVLKRPSMYIGAVDLTETNEYINENNKIALKTIQYVPGLIKIINEIIDNSVDVAIKSNFKNCTQISVKITEDYVEIKDNGTGIPVVESNGKYMPELAWGRMRSGSNFENDDNRTQIGLNGVGSFCTNCFSLNFTGISDDGKKRCTCKFTDNALKCNTSISESKECGVTVKFYPDLKRFNLEKIDENHINIIKQRLINLNLSFPKITFKFNGKIININSFKKYIKMFDDNAELYETENYSFAILHNPNDDFRQFSYVNGLKIPDGGTHIDVISNNIVNRIRDKLSKKFKTIKPGDIKNKLFVIAFLKNLKNTKFNSQTKEKITNSISEINQYFGDIDYDILTKKILKNASIIDPITEVYKIKEELKRRQEMKSLVKPKKIKNEKYLPPIKEQKYLMIVEGECLDSETKVLKSNLNFAKLKDINVGDKLLDKNFKETTVLAKTKSLKETLTIKTANTIIRCGYNHKLFVYDVDDKQFKFVEAYKLTTQNYKLVRSNINEDTLFSTVHDNLNNTLILENNQSVYYTENDYFIVISNGVIIRKHAKDIKPSDCILLIKN